jgi:uncharacterized coiled-coil protein SlyX
MSDVEELSARITNLEIQLTYQEDLVTQLNSVVVEYADLLHGLKAKLLVLENKLLALAPASVEVGTAEDNKPPHY